MIQIIAIQRGRRLPWISINQHSIPSPRDEKRSRGHVRDASGTRLSMGGKESFYFVRKLRRFLHRGKLKHHATNQKTGKRQDTTQKEEATAQQRVIDSNTKHSKMNESNNDSRTNGREGQPQQHKRNRSRRGGRGGGRDSELPEAVATLVAIP